MKISLSWLKEYIDIEESTDEIAHLLTMTGLEVEGIEEVESVRGGLKGVVIGEVIACEKHPNADKLSLAKVDIGKDDPLPIVCGAPNVEKGQKVAVATVGTTLYTYDNREFKIKKSKIRGEVSEGMICAEDELGLSADHQGILVLDTELPIGTPLAKHLKLETDEIFEIGLTPNRADATSHIGVARDIRAVLDREIRMPDVSAFQIDNTDQPVDVSVENTEACPRYSGITISDITVGESPDWLRKRLLSIGQAPINNVVDITNFILHELGQPLHAFDLDKITGRKIIVKTLHEGTPFVTLDEKEHRLKADDLMICDQKGGMCIAGVFGGLDSGVTESSQNIFLESAYFSPDYIRKTSLVHALKTDSAFRFERGTDPNQTVFALKRAAILIKAVTGGKISSEIVDIYPKKIEHFRVSMKYKNIHRLIGKTLPTAEIHAILSRLDIEIEDAGPEGFTALVPSYRVDVTREADVIEEILRIYGYDRIELADNTSSDYLAEFPKKDADKERLKLSEMLTANGYFEISTNSLTNPNYSQESSGFSETKDIEIINKQSEELGVLRQSLLFTGLEVIAYNLNRRQTDLKLFEFGKVYSKLDGKYLEKSLLSLWATGNYESESWMHATRQLQFHDFYGVIVKIINKFIGERYDSHVFRNEIFRHGLILKINNHNLATLGLLNDETLKLAGLKQGTFYCEIDFDYLISDNQPTFRFQEISKYPEVRRDLSLVIDKKITFEEIKKITEDTSVSNVLKKVNVFDYYEGDKLDIDKKAYAITFILQDENKTLTDRAIDKIMDRLIHLFENNLGAIIRK